MVRALAPVARSVIVTQPPLGQRIGDPDRMIALFAKTVGQARVSFEPSHERAVDLALERAGPQDVVCITGSMFLVGAARNRWVPEEQILRTRSTEAERKD